jgi:hypothetical protein
MDKIHTFQVSVTVDHTGKQVHGIVFRDPEEAAKAGHAFPVGDLWVYREDGVVGAIANDEGVIPYRERTSDDEDLGLTWQLAK